MAAIDGGLAMEYVPIERLKPFDGNPRKISERGLEKLQRSVEEFGFVNPILAQRGSCMVIAGHQRLRAAQAAGLAEVPVIWLDMDDVTAKAYNIADNRLQDEAEFDFTPLADLLVELDTGAFDLTLTGFDEDELAQLMEWTPDPDDVEEGEVPEPPEEAITKPGDIWQMGRHRVMCGDATLREDVGRLMGNTLADMVFTDPPYNVDYEGKTKEALKIKNDKMETHVFRQFLLEAFEAMFAATRPGGAVYVCHADSSGLQFRGALVEAGWYLKQCLVWVKNAMVLGRQDYHWKHEPILYGWKPGAAHRWYGGRRQTTVIEDPAMVTVRKVEGGHEVTFASGVQSLSMLVPTFEVLHQGDDSATSVWRIERPSRSADHPTMKPVALPARAMKNSSEPGMAVLDTFGGAGSTLVAAEQLNRRCYTMEIDPRYCDVIVQRWEQLTGQKATLVR